MKSNKSLLAAATDTLLTSASYYDPYIKGYKKTTDFFFLLVLQFRWTSTETFALWKWSYQTKPVADNSAISFNS